MAKRSRNGNAPAIPTLPTIEGLRRAYEEGLEQTLLSGVSVKMHPLQPEKLLAAGNIPDMLTPLVIAMLFPPKEESYDFTSQLDGYIAKERKDVKEKLEFVRSVDVVCQAALLDSTIVPYLSFADRLWIFRLAFYPVEVLSSFRLQSTADVGIGQNERNELLPSEPDAAVDSVLRQAEPVHELPV